MASDGTQRCIAKIHQPTTVRWDAVLTPDALTAREAPEWLRVKSIMECGLLLFMPRLPRRRVTVGYFVWRRDQPSTEGRRWVQRRTHRDIYVTEPMGL